MLPWQFFELETGVNTTRHLALDNITKTEVTEFSIEPTTMRENDYYIIIYCIWMNFIFMGLGPFVLLIVLNALTLKSLVGNVSGNGSSPIIATQSFTYSDARRSLESRPSQQANGPASASKKNEIALAKVSLMIVFIFILCHSVRWIPNVYELIRISHNDKRSWPPWVESVTHISHFLTTLNSSVNFYVYCLKHFSFGCRRATRKAIRRTFHRLEVRNGSTHTDPDDTNAVDERDRILQVRCSTYKEIHMISMDTIIQNTLLSFQTDDRSPNIPIFDHSNGGRINGDFQIQGEDRMELHIPQTSGDIRRNSSSSPGFENLTENRGQMALTGLSSSSCHHHASEWNVETDEDSK